MSVPVKIVKNAWLWGGVGYIIQNYGEKGIAANVWRAVGVASILYGLRVLVNELEE